MIRSAAVILLFASAVAGCRGCGPFRSSQKQPVPLSKTLRLAVGERVQTLDPAFADDAYSAEEVGRVYEGLLQYHYLRRPYTLVPALAETMPEVSVDGKTLIFKLQRGVVFQDDAAFVQTGGKGREVVAEDVVYSLKRLADPRRQSPGWWILDGRIVGLDEWRAAMSKSIVTDYSVSVEGLRALDRYTVQIQLTQRSPSLLYRLAMPFASVVPREVVEKQGAQFGRHPVGTGPFRLTAMSRDRLVWMRNPTFRQEAYPSDGERGDTSLLADAGKRLPFVDQVTVDVVDDPAVMREALIEGRFDDVVLATDLYDKVLAAGPGSEGRLRLDVRVVEHPQLETFYLAFNMADPLLGRNKALRQALSLACDGQRYVAEVISGHGIVAQGPIPPGLSASQVENLNPYRDYNVLRAKELLNRAGFPGGEELPPLRFATASGARARAIIDYVVKSFGAIGVRVSVATYAWPELQEVIRKGDAQLWDGAWAADYPQAEAFFQLFHGRNFPPGPNDARYVSAEFDALYARATEARTDDERLALYASMKQRLAEDVPWISLAHRLGIHLVSSRLRNHKPHDFQGISKYLRLAQ